MKRLPFILLFFLTSLLFSNELKDIRFGSYKNGKLISDNITDSDQTRIIFEFDNGLQYTHEHKNNSIMIYTDSLSTKMKNVYKIKNGLVSNLKLNLNDSLSTINVLLDGKYSLHNLKTIDDPFRLVLDVFGEPDLMLSKQAVTKPEINKQQKIHTDKTDLETKIKQTLDEDEIFTLFKSNEKIYLDLFEIRIGQVLRFFSKVGKVGAL